MSEKLILISVLICGLVVVDIFYILSFSTFLLSFFEKKRNGKIPVWFRLMDSIANVFTATPLSEKEMNERELLLKASSHDYSEGKRTYLGLSVKIPKVDLEENGKENLFSRFSSKTNADATASKDTSDPDSLDEISAREYSALINDSLAEIRKHMEGIEFTKGHHTSYLREGNMVAFNQLNIIRKNLIKAADNVLKVKLRANVKKNFEEIQEHFQEYLSQSILGINSLMDYVYKGDRRMFKEGYETLIEASKSLEEVKRCLREVKN